MILGGYEILCECMAGKLAARGHEIIVLTSNHGVRHSKAKKVERGRFEERIYRNLRLYIPFGKPPRKARLRQLLTSEANKHQTKRLIKQTKPAIVFFWSQRRLSLGSIFAAAESSVPYAVTLNDNFLLAYRPILFMFSPRTTVSYLIERTILERITYRGLRLPAVTAISHTLLKSYLQAGTPLDHAKVIYQGIELEKFPMKGAPGYLHDPARLLYVGQLHDYKGVHVTIEALSILKDKGLTATLSVIGRGPPEYERMLREHAGNCDVAEYVRFLGKIPHGELSEHYQQHDIFLFPSLWEEPFGLTHLEAMACGTPVISTTCGGPGEFLDDGHNALTFEPGNAPQLADKIRLLIDDSQKRRFLAIEGRQKVENHFTTERYARDLEEFLIHTTDKWCELKRAARKF